MLTPFNVSQVTKAIVTQLRADHRLTDARIERSEEVNSIPSQCPWIGVYRQSVQYPSRTLGLGTGYRGQRVGVMLLLQQADPSSGEACEQALESLVQTVLSVLMTDSTIGGSVMTIDEIEVQYPDYQKTADSVFMQTAAIYFTALGGVTAT